MSSCLTTCASALCLLLIGFSPAMAQSRTWKVSNGGETKEIVGEALRLQDKSVVLKNEAGTEQVVALADLSASDRRLALANVIGSGVVELECFDLHDEKMAFGSGFVVSDKGWLVTNYHVIRGAASVTVKLRNGETRKNCRSRFVDRDRDLVVLQFDGELPANTHILQPAADLGAEVGDQIWLIGHPEGLKNTVDWGDITGIRGGAEVGLAKDSLWLQSNALIGPGSSGGPLLDEAGNVLGISTIVYRNQFSLAVSLKDSAEAIWKGTDAPLQDLPLPPGAGDNILAWSSKPILTLTEEYAEKAQELEGITSITEFFTEAWKINGEYGEKYAQLAVDEKLAAWPRVQAALQAISLLEEQPERQGEVASLLINELCTADWAVSVSQHLALRRNGPEWIREIQKKDFAGQHLGSLDVTLLLSLFRQLQSSLDADQVVDVSAVREDMEELIKKIGEEYDGEIVQLGEQKGPAREVASYFKQVLEGEVVGRKAPRTSGLDTNGIEIRLDQYAGKVVLLDFFADWCPHCRAMYEHERELMEKYADKPFVLIGVNRDSEDVLRRIVEKKEVTWPTIADGEQGPTATKWAATSFPSLFLIDHTGLVVGRIEGRPNAERLEKLIDSLIQSAEGTK